MDYSKPQILWGDFVVAVILKKNKFSWEIVRQMASIILFNASKLVKSLIECACHRQSTVHSEFRALFCYAIFKEQIFLMCRVFLTLKSNTPASSVSFASAQRPTIPHSRLRFVLWEQQIRRRWKKELVVDPASMESSQRCSDLRDSWVVTFVTSWAKAEVRWKLENLKNSSEI